MMVGKQWVKDIEIAVISATQAFRSTE